MITYIKFFIDPPHGPYTEYECGEVGYVNAATTRDRINQIVETNFPDHTRFGILRLCVCYPINDMVLMDDAKMDDTDPDSDIVRPMSHD